MGNNTKLGGLAFRHCLRNFILGAGEHIPIEKSASVADCGSKSLLKNCTAELLSPPKSSEQLVDNESDTMSVVGDLDSILSSMISDAENQKPTNISLDLPQTEDEFEDETTDHVKGKKEKQRNVSLASNWFIF